MLGKDKTGSDPRRDMPADALEAASVNAMPAVAKSSTVGDSLGLAAGVLGACVLGGITLFSMSGNRQMTEATPAVAAVPAPASPDATMDFPATPLPEGEALPPQPLPPQPMPPEPVTRTDAVAGGTNAAVMVFDNSIPIQLAPDGKPAAAAATGGNAPMLTGDEQFFSTQTSNLSNRASRMENPSAVLPQGAVIPAVLETALNSDLPGYARALVSRDVRSFDGKTVLIPRGSRLIGQYKSGLSLGVTRAFVIWNRVIRPDGVSVQLGSPATDDMGQAGLSGSVDTHFAKRFGSAILMSVINGVVASNGSRNNTIVIGSSSDATNAATSALQENMRIPPTIKVAQGTPVQVFVARDLDFSVAD
ncbi:MAG: type IV secretion system protein VirB10 [Asticcacaulis sp.]